MDTETKAPPLDSVIAEMERKWRDSGIPGLYAGGNGPVSRERARATSGASLRSRTGGISAPDEGGTGRADFALASPVAARVTPG